MRLLLSTSTVSNKRGAVEQSQVELSCNIFIYLQSIKTFNDFSLFLSDVGIGNRWNLDSPADVRTGREIPAVDEKVFAEGTPTEVASAEVLGSEGLALRQVNSRGGLRSLPSDDRKTAPLLTAEGSSRKVVLSTLHPNLNLSYLEKVTSFPATSIHTNTTIKEQSNGLTWVTESVGEFYAWLLRSTVVRTTGEVTTAADYAGRGKEAVVNTIKSSVAALERDVKSFPQKQSKAGFSHLEPDEHDQTRRIVPTHQARESIHTSLSHDLTPLYYNSANRPNSEVNEINYQNDTLELITVTQSTTSGEHFATEGNNAIQGKNYSDNTVKTTKIPTVTTVAFFLPSFSKQNYNRSN